MQINSSESSMHRLLSCHCSQPPIVMLWPGSAWIPRLRLGFRGLRPDIFGGRALGRNMTQPRLGPVPEPRLTGKFWVGFFEYLFYTYIIYIIIHSSITIVPRRKTANMLVGMGNTENDMPTSREDLLVVVIIDKGGEHHEHTNESQRLVGMLWWLPKCLCWAVVPQWVSRGQGGPETIHQRVTKTRWWSL